METRIKICCMESVDEVRLALKYRASAIGLVSWMPSGPGPIEEDRIIEIAGTMKGRVATFLLTCLTDPEEIAAQVRRCGTTTVQLCDAVPVEGLQDLRRLLPGISIVQVIHVAGDPAIAEAAAVAPCVDAILLDSGNPGLPVKELGGTGRVHDWRISSELCRSVDVPVFLAGGLKPENVAGAVRTVRPYGVDVCSGVRTNGKLDEGKLSAFVAAVAAGGAQVEA